jgi:hypothetical protein
MIVRMVVVLLLVTTMPVPVPVPVPVILLEKLLEILKLQEMVAAACRSQILLLLKLAMLMLALNSWNAGPRNVVNVVVKLQFKTRLPI